MEHMIRQMAIRAAALAALAATMAVGASAQDRPLQNDILGARFNTFWGPYGLITVPDAYAGSANRAVAGTLLGDQKAFTVNYGIVNGVDLGLAYIDRNTMSNKLIANAKINLIPSNFRGFQIGAGVIDATDSINNTTYVMASFQTGVPEALASKYVGLRLHAGYGTGIYREKIIGGGELLINNRSSIVGEWNGTKANAGVRYIADDNIRLQAGIENKEFFLGLSIGFTAR
jgi:hypothetical protein